MPDFPPCKDSRCLSQPLPGPRCWAEACKCQARSTPPNTNGPHCSAAPVASPLLQRLQGLGGPRGAPGSPEAGQARERCAAVGPHGIRPYALPCLRDTTAGQKRAGRRSVRQAGSTGSCRVCIEAHLCSRRLPPGMAVRGCLGVAPLAGQVPAIPGCDGSRRQSTESLAPDPIPALPQSSTCTRAT